MFEYLMTLPGLLGSYVADPSGLVFLAASEPSGFFGSLLANIVLWGRVALGIGLVIFVHELGHFVAAKSFGVKCEKFYVGFDVPISIGPIKLPRTLGKFTYGETEYGIGIIPLGGYVKMLGQDDDPRKLEEENKRIQVDGDIDESPELDPRSFPAKPVWQRMIIISAGVVVNVITGILFAAIAFGFGVPYSPAIVGGVTPGGPAWQAGMEPGGKVVAVGELKEEEMHFREMRIEVVTQGFKSPDDPTPVSIQYEDGIREYQLPPASMPQEKDMRMIGVTMPNSVTLESENYAIPESVAGDVLTEEDAGATLVSFDGTPIDRDRIVPGTPFRDHVYSNPTKPIELTFERTDGTQNSVTLPPQQQKSFGIRFSLGPVTALVSGGPAEEAGLKVGDLIESVTGMDRIDPYSLAVELVGASSPHTFIVRRGDESIDIEITPDDSMQTRPPTISMSEQIAINQFGLAYKPTPIISAIEGASSENESPQSDTESTDDSLQIGDRIKEVRLLTSEDDMPEYMDDPGFQEVLKELRKGWEFSSRTSLAALVESMQMFPLGTKFEVYAVRPPEERVISTTIQLSEGELVTFERGLRFPPSESIQRADSIGSAFALGLKEGRRRFDDVLRFLGMVPRGQVKLKHVGGPLAIVDIAKHEAEQGIARQLMFLTMLSMNLAILNFLPIPALDGGHMVFLTYELIAGKRANEQLEFRLTVAGLLMLLTIMVVVFANDIMRMVN